MVTGRSGVLGKTFYVHEDFWPLNTSLWIKEFKNSTPIYAFYLLSGLDFNSYNAGSAVPTPNRNHVHNLSILLPSMDIIDMFDELVTPIKKHQKMHEGENQYLVSIRDALLPKLMNGEISVGSDRVTIATDVGAKNFSPLRAPRQQLPPMPTESQ